jgi:hypothetical protein
VSAARFLFVAMSVVIGAWSAAAAMAPQDAAPTTTPAPSAAPPAANPPPAPRTAPPSAPAKGKTPWCVELGLRVAGVESKVPVIDRVVLVKDEAAFLDEIAHWRLESRWPVLIEDDVYAPQFIRAFKPAQVLRRVDKAPAIDDPAALKAAIQKAVASVWNAATPDATPLQAITAQTYTPPGIAAMSPADPAWVAGVALAAGRGLVPAFLEGNFGGANDTLAPDKFAEFAKSVEALFAGVGLPYNRLGDALDALALCRTTAQLTQVDVPANQRPSGRGMPPIKPTDPVATTDALCRNADGSRYAFCGAIFGTSKYAAYAAMCSLFLSRETIGGFDSYQAGDYSSYDFVEFAQKLPESGYKVQIWSGPKAHMADWRQLLAQGFDGSVLFVNSSGYYDFFDLGNPGKVPMPERGSPGDVPVLSLPLALHMVHSWSLNAPATRDTIGGRWLEAGVYAYVGSVHEPFLMAFCAPAEVMARCEAFVPFLIASRQWDGPFAAPWRVATLGDPLMLAMAPKSVKAAPRVAPPPPVPGQEDLTANCRKLLARSKDDRDGLPSIAAMRELIHRGEDRIAAQFWLSCADKSFAPRVAPLALEPLFRQRDADQFLAAYRMVPEPSARAKDMLWQLWGEQLTRVRDGDTILLFEQAVRSPWAVNDWRRLMPVLGRLIDVEHAQSALQRAIQREKDPSQQKLLRELAKQS